MARCSVRPLVWLALALLPGLSQALDVMLDDRRSSVETLHQGRVIKVQRNQDASHQLTGRYANTAQTCPPDCLQPGNLGQGVTTVTEVEVFDFLEREVIAGEGLLVDAREEAAYAAATIPASLNLAAAVFQADMAALAEALYPLGVARRGDVGVVARALEQFRFNEASGKTSQWDFSQAKTLIVWSDGAWCAKAPALIRQLLRLGYPAERIHYYRGGMQAWQLFGLTTVGVAQP